MKIHQIIRPRTIALLVIILVLSAVTYGFAAANTVPESGAGDGSGTISGYGITSIVYSIFGDSDPSDIETVTFDVAPLAGAAAPGSVYAKLDASSATWVTCSNIGGNTWQCDFAGTVNTVDADELRVVAVE